MSSIKCCASEGCDNRADGVNNMCLPCNKVAAEQMCEVCPVHNVALGEGAPCHVCEQLAHQQACVQAFAYIDNVVRGRSINHISPSQRTPGQHIAFLCICLSPYGASASQIIHVMRLKDIPGSNETVEAVLEYLK